MASDEIREEIRQDLKPNLKKVLKANPAYKLARYVDAQPLDRMVISSYSDYEDAMRPFAGTDTEVEKNRARYGSGYHPAEVPLDTPFAKIYLDLIGKGINGTNAPSTVDEKYTCPGCGVQFAMSMKLAPLECPRCGRLTPRGILERDAPGWYKR